MHDYNKQHKQPATVHASTVLKSISS